MQSNKNPAEKARILKELSRISGKLRCKQDGNEFREIKLLIEKIFDPKTPTYELNITDAGYAFINCRENNWLPEKHKEAFKEVFRRVRKVLEDLGYRQNIATVQEHKIVGSSQPEEFHKRPYTPVGILEGKLSVAEARRARALEMIRYAAPYYYGLKFRHVPVSCEPLDDAGNTVRDPRVIDESKFPGAYEAFMGGRMSLEQMLDACTMPAARLADYPFRRD